MIHVSHSGSAGDLIYGLPIVRAMAAAGEQVRFFIPRHVRVRGQVDTPNHPYRMSDRVTASVLPLLRAQPGIADAQVHQGERIDVTLDAFRNVGGSPWGYGRVGGHIAWRHLACSQRWHWDLSQPWLEAEPDPDFAGAVLVAYTRRYPCKFIGRGWHAIGRLAGDGARVVYVGLPEEWQRFRHVFGPGNNAIEYVATGDLLQVARMIAASRLFVGNQGSPWAIAEAMKVCRVQQTCTDNPDCLPIGANGRAAFAGHQFEHWVEQAYYDGIETPRTTRPRHVRPRQRLQPRSSSPKESDMPAQPEKVVLQGQTFWRYQDHLYPDYLHHGNAASMILHVAERYCQGSVGLDIGCKDWTYPGATGIDNNPGLNAHELDPFEDGSVDYVFSSHCLEHLERWQEALALWCRKIRQGGHLFLYLPHISNLMWRPGGPWVGRGHKWSPTLGAVTSVLELHDMAVVAADPGPDAYWSFHVAARKT